MEGVSRRRVEATEGTKKGILGLVYLLLDNGDVKRRKQSLEDDHGRKDNFDDRRKKTTRHRV